MTALFGFTVRQLVWQRKIWLALLIVAFPSLVILLVRHFDAPTRSDEIFELFHGPAQFILLMIVLPLVCMLYGTALVGEEVEQRTFVYLTTRRLRRATVLLVRFVATWLVLSVLFELGIVALHAAALWGMPTPDPMLIRDGFGPERVTWHPWHDLAGYLVIMPLGVAGYLAVFTTLSLIFGRPLIVAVIYLVASEMMLANIPVMARQYAILHHLRQMAVNVNRSLVRLFGGPEELVEHVFPPGWSGAWTLLTVIGVLLLTCAVLISIRELTPSRVSRD